ncbi:MAG: UxaA family hydrolase, partial [Rhodospirillaceae bacterium]|nr:UxaA family hydrolase [Rhodospirillaceae bacterium]
MTPPKAVGLTIRLHPADNVVVASQAISGGSVIPGEGVTTASAVPAGHKIATAPIASGAFVRKYNQIIGVATADIAPGQHVHVQNCAMSEFERDYAFCADAHPTAYFTGKDRATFQGIVRADGRVATRNYIGVMTTVNCSATVAKRVAAAFENGGLDEYPNIDGVVALVHSTGCGMATKGEGFDALQRVLWGYLRHPNFAGVLLIGLGCEAAQIRFLLEAYGIKA